MQKNNIVGRGLGQMMQRPLRTIANFIPRPLRRGMFVLFQRGGGDSRALRPMYFTTEDDIRAAYRIFLQRPLTDDELRFWTENFLHRGLPLHEFSVRFRGLPEVRARLESLGQPKLVPVPAWGFRMYASEGDVFVGKAIADSGEWEPHVCAELLSHLQEGMCFVDVGANIGFFSLLVAKRVGETGKVVAIEPNRENAALLRRSIEWNDLANIHVVEKAASDKHAQFTLHPDSASTLSLLVDDRSSASYAASWVNAHATPSSPTATAGYVVDAVPLDDLLANEQRIDVIKIDTDGHDDQVLRGMTRIIAKFHPIIFSEFYPKGYADISGGTATAYLDQLFASSYIVKSLSPLPDQSRQFNATSDFLAFFAQLDVTYIDIVAIPT